MSISLAKMLCLVAFASSALGLRRRARAEGEENSSALVWTAADCETLANLTVNGHHIGKSAQMLCESWPKSFGEFPADDAQTLADIVNKGSDIWQKVKEMADERQDGKSFCWAKSGSRELLSDDTGFAAVAASDNVTDTNLGTFNKKKCDMVVSNPPWRWCYGPCPEGMKGMAVVGDIYPVCTSDCKFTTHKTPCMFGCSTGWGSCFTTVFNQISVVAKTLAKMTSYLSGVPEIHTAVDHVLMVVDFFISTLFKVVAVAKDVLQDFPREEICLTVLIAFLEKVLEHAQDIGNDLQHLKSQFGETIAMFLEVLDAEFNWKKVNLGFISDTLVKHESSILTASFEFVEAFVFPPCEQV